MPGEDIETPGDDTDTPDPTATTPAFDDEVTAAADKYPDAEPAILHAIMEQESGHGQAKELDVPGPAGRGDAGHGHGLMQIDNRSHQDFLDKTDAGGKPAWQDPAENIKEGARIYQDAYNQAKAAGVPAERLREVALNGYNHGPAAAISAWKKGTTFDNKYAESVLAKISAPTLTASVAQTPTLTSSVGPTPKLTSSVGPTPKLTSSVGPTPKAGEDAAPSAASDGGADQAPEGGSAADAGVSDAAPDGGAPSGPTDGGSSAPANWKGATASAATDGGTIFKFGDGSQKLVNGNSVTDVPAGGAPSVASAGTADAGGRGEAGYGSAAPSQKAPEMTAVEPLNQAGMVKPAAPQKTQLGSPQGEPAAAPPAPGAPANGAPKPPAAEGPAKPDEALALRQQADAAITESAKAESDQNAAISKQATDSLAARQKLADANKIAEDSRQTQAAAKLKANDELNDKISEAKVDAEAWWTSRGPGQKLAAVISMFLGGMSGKSGGGPEMIREAIQQNIDAQKTNIANRRAGAEAKDRGLGRYLQISGDARASEAGQLAELNSMAKDRLDAIGLQTKDPIIKARAQQARVMVAGDEIKNRNDWADKRSQTNLRNAETTGAELSNSGKILDEAAKLRAQANGMPVGAKVGEIIPIPLEGEAEPRYTYGTEGNKRVQAAYVGTRGTMDAVDKMTKIVRDAPWASLVDSFDSGGDVRLQAERAVSQLFTARGLPTQPNEVIQKALLEHGLLPKLFTSNKAYLARLASFKQSVMREGNDVISSGTIGGRKYFAEGPADLQPGVAQP